MKIVIDIPTDQYNEIVYVNYERLRDIVRDGVVIEKCEDAISREQAIKATYGFERYIGIDEAPYEYAESILRDLPPVTPQQKMGHCKDCKYFEYDSVAKVDGIPLIVAHESCSKWGDGCKTTESGYRFLFEQKESEERR